MRNRRRKHRVSNPVSAMLLHACGRIAMRPSVGWFDSLPHYSYIEFVKLRYRFRCYPTPAQEGVLAHTFGACRYAYSTVSVYNWALRLRTDSYRNGVTVNYNASSAALTSLK